MIGVSNHLSIFRFHIIIIILSFGDWIPTWRIIPLSKWLVTSIYKPFRPFGRGITPVRGLAITMVINQLQVLGWSSKYKGIFAMCPTRSPAWFLRLAEGDSFFRHKWKGQCLGRVGLDGFTGWVGFSWLQFQRSFIPMGYMYFLLTFHI